MPRVWNKLPHADQLRAKDGETVQVNPGVTNVTQKFVEDLPPHIVNLDAPPAIVTPVAGAPDVAEAPTKGPSQSDSKPRNK